MHIKAEISRAAFEYYPTEPMADIKKYGVKAYQLIFSRSLARHIQIW